MYGRPPRQLLGLTMVDTTAPQDPQTWLKDRELMVKLVRQHLLRAQQRIKAQADKGRSDREFNVGDSVYLNSNRMSKLR